MKASNTLAKYSTKPSIQKSATIDPILSLLGCGGGNKKSYDKQYVEQVSHFDGELLLL